MYISKLITILLYETDDDGNGNRVKSVKLCSNSYRVHAYPLFIAVYRASIYFHIKMALYYENFI
jgi:hypothetical protein